MSKRANVALFFNADMTKHTHPWPHIEKCTRAHDCYEHLEKSGVLANVQEHTGRKATDAELLTVHSAKHVAEVHRMTEAARSDPDNRELCEPDGPGGIYYSPWAEHCARLACGCVIDAAHHVLGVSEGGGAGSSSSSSSSVISPTAAGSPSNRRPRTAFALVRPPGHHAGADDTEDHRAEGFCFFNSVAVAAGCVLRSGAAQRVCILDWDVHHGNGTQQLFYDDGRVLYISLHRFGDRWYPETGEVDEVGEGQGEGLNVNIPWPENGLGDSDYLAAFNLIVMPIILAHNPDLLLLSAGFDAADGDAQGKMRVTPKGFASLTTLLLRKLRCPMAAALEGGYNRVVTPQCTEAVIKVLLGERVDLPEQQLLHACCEPTLREVIKAQEKHWPILAGQEESIDRFFREAAEKGQPPRVSKRERTVSSRVLSPQEDEMRRRARRRSNTGKKWRALQNEINEEEGREPVE